MKLMICNWNEMKTIFIAIASIAYTIYIIQESNVIHRVPLSI